MCSTKSCNCKSYLTQSFGLLKLFENITGVHFINHNVYTKIRQLGLTGRHISF